MNWVLFFSMHYRVPCLSTVYCFQPRATLRNWVCRQSVFFECDQSMRWLPIVEMNIERVLFSHIVSRKDLRKTFLVLVWILIERPYKWRHQFPLDLSVFKARNLRILHCLRSSEYQIQLAELWSGMKVKILFYLLENSRFLSSTLTFGYVWLRVYAFIFD